METSDHLMGIEEKTPPKIVDVLELKKARKITNRGVLFQAAEKYGNIRFKLMDLSHPRMSALAMTIDLELRAKYQVKKNKNLPPVAQLEKNRQLSLATVLGAEGTLAVGSDVVNFSLEDPKEKVQSFLAKHFLNKWNPEDEDSEAYDTNFAEMLLALNERYDAIDPKELVETVERGDVYVVGYREAFDSDD